MGCANIKLQLEKINKIKNGIFEYNEKCKNADISIDKLVKIRETLKKEIYDFSMFFEEHAAEYTKLALILANGSKILSTFHEGYMRVELGGSQQLINTNGELFFPKGDTPHKFDIVKLGNFSCGLLLVKTTNEESYYINNKGKKVINGDAFNGAIDFIKPDNVAAASIGLYDFIFNTKGETISTHFQNIQGIYNGVVMANEDNQYYLCNFAGEKITEDSYATADFQEEDGIYKVSYDNKSFFLINSRGQKIGENYTDARGFRNGRGQVKIDGKWNFIDKEGKIICGGYDDAYIFRNGRAFVKINQKWSVIDTYGNVLFGGFDDEGVHVFAEGRAHVAKDGHHSIIDVNGNIIFNGDFTSAGMFNNGTCTLSNDINSYAIDINGKIMPL